MSYEWRSELMPVLNRKCRIRMLYHFYAAASFFLPLFPPLEGEGAE